MLTRTSRIVTSILFLLRSLLPGVVWRRLLAFKFTIFVAFGLAKPILILFGVIALLAANWTWTTLRTQAS